MAFGPAARGGFSNIGRRRAACSLARYGVRSWPVTGKGISDPLMRRLRYLDKLVEELARGKEMSSILRGG